MKKLTSFILTILITLTSLIGFGTAQTSATNADSPLKSKLFFYGNYSDTNYMMTLNPDTYALYYQSNDTSVYTLRAEASSDETALIITGAQPGGAEKDLLFKTQTNKGINVDSCAGDNKAMQLSFKAKALVEDTKIYFRWGFADSLASVTLSTQLQEYTIDMNKQPTDSSDIYSYFDKAGTVYISDFVLRDASASKPTKPETSDLLKTREYTVGEPYGDLLPISRDGYTFMGWYTSKVGGAKITKNTVAMDSHTAVYARWTKTSDSSGKIIFGDTDLSGLINIKDTTLIQKNLAGITELTSKQIFAANVLNNDDLNIKDATAIQKWCASIYSGSLIINTSGTYTN